MAETLAAYPKRVRNSTGSKVHRVGLLHTAKDYIDSGACQARRRCAFRVAIEAAH